MLRAFVGSLDGTVTVRDSMTAPADEPETLGEELAERLRAAGADLILAELRDGGNTVAGPPVAEGPVPGGAR